MIYGRGGGGVNECVSDRSDRSEQDGGEGRRGENSFHYMLSKVEMLPN